MDGSGGLPEKFKRLKITLKPCHQGLCIMNTLFDTKSRTHGMLETSSLQLWHQLDLILTRFSPSVPCPIWSRGKQNSLFRVFLSILLKHRLFGFTYKRGQIENYIISPDYGRMRMWSRLFHDLTWRSSRSMTLCTWAWRCQTLEREVDLFLVLKPRLHLLAVASVYCHLVLLSRRQ